MMLLLVKLRLRKSVRMKHLDIPPTLNAPSGQRRSAVFQRKMSRSTLQSLDVPRNQESSVPQLVVDSSKEQSSLEPQRTCKHVTKLVPKLTPSEECVDVPK